MVSGNVNIDLKLKSYRNDTPLETRILFYSIKRRKLRSLASCCVVVSCETISTIGRFSNETCFLHRVGQVVVYSYRTLPRTNSEQVSPLVRKNVDLFRLFRKTKRQLVLFVTFAISSLRFIRAGNFISSGKERIEKRCRVEGE